MLIDLSHTVRDGLLTYRGLPPPRIGEHLTREASRAHYAPGTEFQIGRIEMVANTGTYLDAPFHRYAGGKDLSQLPLESLADLPGFLLRVVRGGRAIDAPDLDGLDVRGHAVLVETGWSRHWGSERYFEGHPFLTRTAGERLRDAGAALVGIDSYNIDDTGDRERPVHSTLLAAEIPIVEHLTGLDALPVRGFRFSAVPVKIEAFGTFPVRAFAVVGG